MDSQQINETTRDPSNCPISGANGSIRRTMTGRQIFDLYQTYHLQPISPKHFRIPLDTTVTEYHSPESGLIWYYPRELGDGAYYAHLGQIYPGYYNPGCWDKIECLRQVMQQKPAWVIEIGSGDGWLLEHLAEKNITAIGIEINQTAIANCRANNLKVYHPDETFVIPEGDGVVCMLQTLEHLNDPLGVLSNYIHTFKPKYLHLSAPCYESLLGHTSDPLAWPPHHATSWSEKAMSYLGNKLGYKSISTTYSPLHYSEFAWKQQRELNKKFFLIPRFPSGRLGRIAFLLSRFIKRPWNTRAHSIYSVFEVQDPKILS